jgi:XTP/dITP diphosphohydrolase
MKIVLATGNRDKIKEIEAIMASTDVTLISPDAFEGGLPDVIEDGETLHDNALKKAREIREFTGMTALADDSGLEVDALDGAPGVYSSRYAGENVTYDDNNRKLLSALEGVPEEKRAAHFRCVMALALVNTDAEVLYGRMRAHGNPVGIVSAAGGLPDAMVTEGILHGRITTRKRGASGFGFDPVFEIAGQTLAEMGLEEKNKISHRYRALVEMRALLVRYGMASED